MAEDALLWHTDEEEETDLPNTEWDPYDYAVNSENQDVLNELFASDDEYDDFCSILNILASDFSA
jgi:hypothetical protein